ncbi:MAG: malic enzyme-like NAD(P)-binding protein [Planctomycetota bacterium]
MGLKEDALAYHEAKPQGKIAIAVTKPCLTAAELSLAYTPGVAAPCLEIEKDPEAAYRYTNRGNLVAVISDGTAVLGLGNIGALAGKPVMEGKSVLFKRFADVDAFDIEIDCKDMAKLVDIIASLEPTFGGINLEDIKAPECFFVEDELKKRMKIPVFHDDQHGTAIITGAALLNICGTVGKKMNELRVVVSGAGASAIACSHHYIRLGVRRENIVLVDTKGVVSKSRKDLNPQKSFFAADTTAKTLAEAMKGADLFLGLSAKGLVTPDMVRAMAKNPVVFALANPDPEISYPDAKGSRPDVLVATGRSDFPNQVNNVLGFPFIFRGALDVRASTINEEMKVAASRALADLAREPVPAVVSQAYGGAKIAAGPDYFIPKPFDPRLMPWVSTAVAGAAMETGVACRPVDIAAYRKELESRAEAMFSKKQKKVRM